MFGPPRPQFPHMRWDHHRPQHNPHWRHPFGPRAPFRGQHQRFNQPRPSFQSGNDNYWCETCDRGFPTEDILKKHNEQHQKCNIDGCQFIAHPKVITKHIQMQHSTGLYKKIANIKNPEEIEKWREERRRRYPTKANIDKKAAERKEKIDRGEKMGLERERNYTNKQNSEQNNKPDQGLKRKFNTRNENQPRSKFKRNNPNDNNHNKNPRPTAKPKPTPILVEDKRLKPFAGILNLQMDSDNEIENETTELNGLIEDEEDCEEFTTENVEKIPENTEPVVCGALSSLMCEYGSSEEDDSEVINTDSKDQKVSKIIQNSISNVWKPDKVTMEKDSLDIMKCDTATNKESINLNSSVCTQLTDGEDNDVIRQEAETNTDSFDLVNKDQNNDRGKSLENNTIIKDVTVTSMPIDNGQNQNSNDCGPEVETEMSKTSSIEGSGNIIQEHQSKEDSVKETIHNEDDGDSGPEEIKVEVRKDDDSLSLAGVEDSKPKDVRKNIVKRRVQVNHRRRPKLPSTLLQKLLFKEMKQERNIVLQCIRYIRRNNYFDKKE